MMTTKLKIIIIKIIMMMKNKIIIMLVNKKQIMQRMKKQKVQILQTVMIPMKTTISCKIIIITTMEMEGKNKKLSKKRTRT